jgi:pimeloyl-ACP methyl ester carboxylesterase
VRAPVNTRKRRVAALVATSAAVAAVLAALPGSAIAGPSSDPEVVAASVAPDNGRTCKFSGVPVDLEVGTPVTPGSDLTLPVDGLGQQELLVKMCLPEGNTPSAVQVLIHGITYDHRYWNIADPDDPSGDRYSWEAAAAEAGYATLAIDRLGNGQSTHPPSAAVTIDSNAAAVHDIVQALRAGTIEGPDGPVGFDEVVLVGHSYGSITSTFEASRFGDVDALLLTGYSHNIRETNTPLAIESQHYPAFLDPQFAGSNLDPGYVTSRPGTRYDLFYAPGTDVDPRIVERDEATKGTVSQFEIANFPIFFRTVLDGIDVPVFIVNGSLDGIFCSQSPGDLAADCSAPEALVANEEPWFPNAPSLEAAIIPEAGHVLNAFRSSQETFDAAMDWLSGTVPAT